MFRILESDPLSHGPLSHDLPGRHFHYEGATESTVVSRGRVSKAKQLLGKSRAKTVGGKGKALIRGKIARKGRGKAAQIIPNKSKKLTTAQVRERTRQRAIKQLAATRNGKKRTKQIIKKARRAAAGRPTPLPLGR